MRRADLADLAAFLAVAEESSFTRAAARLGTSQATLSFTVRRLEERLGLRLLTRTTRSVAPTAAGESLLETLRPALSEIDDKLAALSGLRDKPAGTVRLTASDHAAETVLWPVLERLVPAYPDVKAEVSVSQSLIDIVAERFDAGVRLGEQVEKDMVAVRIGPDLRMAVVGAPSYFATHPAPRTPQDLTRHACISMRMPTSGSVYAWEFEKNGHALKVRVDGSLVLSGTMLHLKAVRAGLGLACLFEDLVACDIKEGRLVRVLNDWCQSFVGYHLYYPSRRQPTPAFKLLVEALRHQNPS